MVLRTNLRQHSPLHYTMKSLLPLLLLLAASSPVARGARLPGSPFPVIPLGGQLNSTRSLFLLEQSNFSLADKLLASTLQGAVSRSAGGPAIYRADHVTRIAGNSYMMWANETAALFGVSLALQYASDLRGLLAHHAGLLSGYVLSNANDSSANTAISVCAALKAVAVTPDNEATAVAAGLTRLYDVRGKDTAWVLATFNASGGPFYFSRSLTVLQDWAKVGFMGDYAVAAGALQWWDADISSPLADRVLGSMTGAFAAVGWGPDERVSVGRLSAFGGGMVASDWAQNLDVLSSFEIPTFQQKAAAVPPPPPPPAGQHTVAFLMSDGDNAQFVLGGFATDAQHWGSGDRGSVALGWTFSPALAELAPAAMSYVYRTASPGAPAGGRIPEGTDGRDLLVASVSGFSYAYPDLMTGAQRAAFAATTGAFLQKSDMRIVNVLANASGMPSAAVAADLLALPMVDALIWYPYDDYSGLRGAVQFVHGKPIIGGRYNLWGDGSGTTCGQFCNPAQTVERLLAASRNGSCADGYSLIPVHAWSHNVSDVLWIATELERRAPGAVAVVTPDVLVARLVAGAGPAAGVGGARSS